ncbi:MAG: alpha/beta fold hydrolase [Anaerolineae bacterium]|nr:MAG: alpha/beta fold hydrolase [Anaerolineae bacterium]
MPLQDRYLYLDNVRVRYWQAGQNGTPALLVHGFGASVEWWEQNVAALAARHRVYALDLPGFGRSERLPETLSPSMAAGFLRHFLDAVDVAKAHVVANSMGGLIALQFSAQYPDAVDRLVLVSPAGFTRQIHWVFRLLPLPVLGRWLIRPNRHKLETFHRRLIHGDSSWLTADWLDRIHALGHQPGASQMLFDVARIGVNPGGIKASILGPLHQALSHVTAPTLIVWGDRDRLVPPAQAQIGQRLLSNAEIHIFPGCGHCPQLERAAEFNELLLTFFKPE